MLVDESGRLLGSKDSGRSFSALPVGAGMGLTGLLQTADGVLVLSGARGLSRLDLAQLLSEVK
jgi:hypothetical protein